MPEQGKPGLRKGIRLRRLKVRNFKVLDELDLELPAPEVPGDPDVLVLGSRNGLGKTSVLEACALLFVGARTSAWPELDWRSIFGEPGIPLDVPDLVVRTGQDEVRVEGELEIEGSACALDVSMYRASRRIFARGDTSLLQTALRAQGASVPRIDPLQAAREFVYTVTGQTMGPLVCPPLVYFHSYRKVREGRVELGGMIDRNASGREGGVSSSRLEPLSAFKLTVLRSMMGQKGLFEGVEDAEAQETIEKLNSIMREYAGGTIEKLQFSPDNTIEFRVSCGDNGTSFTFDGLSSGQKEIISTFFLIWLHTHSCPGIVLIDEPELHLNAEWQVGLVRRLCELVPGNQFIIATHSQDVFGSVEPSRRVMLEASKGAAHGGG